jgi:hypothetical protein
MDPLGPHPLIRSFERHLYAENHSTRTVITYLIAVRQADSFLRQRGTSLEAATRGDLEAFLGDPGRPRERLPVPDVTDVRSRVRDISDLLQPCSLSLRHGPVGAGPARLGYLTAPGIWPTTTNAWSGGTLDLGLGPVHDPHRGSCVVGLSWGTSSSVAGTWAVGIIGRCGPWGWRGLLPDVFHPPSPIDPVRSR